MTLVVLGICVFGGHGSLRGVDYNKWGNALHITFVRPVWAIGVAWIILACISGHGGPINSFLSHSVFQVLSRLTYSMFIIHELFLLALFASIRQNVRFTDFEMVSLYVCLFDNFEFLPRQLFFFQVYQFFSDFAICTVFSIGLCLAFESPMITIEKLLFGNFGKKKPEEKTPTA